MMTSKPRRGRPPKEGPTLVKLDAAVHPDVKRALKERARLESVSVSRLVNRILAEELGLIR